MRAGYPCISTMNWMAGKKTPRPMTKKWRLPGSMTGHRCACIALASMRTRVGGTSWAYILRNNSLTLRIRRKPLGGIIAQAQLGSECLWRCTPLAALNELDALIKAMWGITKGEWQNSQVHLCHDVMHLSIELDQLGQYVSRSRTQAIFDAARADIEAQFGVGAGDDAMDWGDIYGGDDAFYDPMLALGQEVDLVREDVEDRGVTVYRWGRRLSGVAWSQGGDISLVQYLKTLEIQRTGKRHMVPLWQGTGLHGHRDGGTS